MKTGELVLIIISILFAACNNKTQQENKIEAVTDTINERAENAEGKEFKTSSGKTIVISETHPVGASLSNIEIFSKDLEDTSSIKIVDADPIFKIEKADLDKNGFDELFIITQSAGSGSNGDVKIITTENDARLITIPFPQVSEKETEKGGLFENYQGHDSFMIKSNQLVRSFPEYKSNDPNSAPAGSEKQIIYTLKNNQIQILGKP